MTSATIRLDNVTKTLTAGCWPSTGHARHRRRRVLFLAGPVGLRQDHVAAHDCGLRAPGSGRVHVAGRDITDLPVHKRDMGMVFQSYALFLHRTVAENVAFGLRMREVAKPDIERRVKAALARSR